MQKETSGVIVRIVFLPNEASIRLSCNKNGCSDKFKKNFKKVFGTL
jgi:hypothetical protein